MAFDPNLIHRSDAAAINVSTLILTDKSGDGNCTIQTVASGVSNQFLGIRYGFENITGVYTIPQHKSGYTWTNTNVASGVAAAILPTGALVGTSALFIRTGGMMRITPPVGGAIWATESGYFRPDRQSIYLQSSGAKIGLVCNGSDDWYPYLEEGTIQ